jgi:hypothetical protein
MATEINATTIIRTARDLASENGENPEYDRALVEMTTDLLRLDPEVGSTLRMLYPDPGDGSLQAVVRLRITGLSE